MEDFKGADTEPGILEHKDTNKFIDEVEELVHLSGGGFIFKSLAIGDLIEVEGKLTGSAAEIQTIKTDFKERIEASGSTVHFDSGVKNLSVLSPVLGGYKYIDFKVTTSLRVES